MKEQPRSRLVVLHGGAIVTTVMECPAVNGEIHTCTCHDCWHSMATEWCKSCDLGSSRWGPVQHHLITWDVLPEAVQVDEKLTAKLKVKVPTLEELVGTAQSKKITGRLKAKGATPAERRKLIAKVRKRLAKETR